MTGCCIGRHRRLLGLQLLSQRLEFLLVSGCIFTPLPPLLYPPIVRQYPRHRRQHPSHKPDIFSWYFDQQPLEKQTTQAIGMKLDMPLLFLVSLPPPGGVGVLTSDDSQSDEKGAKA